jgi:oligoribonuclease (3'-5' exoribonuclease)
MKYISLDIETTSLESNPNNILMISMVVEDSQERQPLIELPHFTCLIKRDKYEGQPYALGLNGWIFKQISGQEKAKYPIYKNDEWILKALIFLSNNFGDKKVTIAGKNVASFDLQFLPIELKKKFHHRCIDPGSTFIDWSKDTVLDLSSLKKSLNLSEIVTHDAYEDALDVINVLRKSYE